MARTTKIIGFSVSPALHKEVERLARREGKTKSELFREMAEAFRKTRRKSKQEGKRGIQPVPSPLSRLRPLCGVISLGGDALRETERLDDDDRTGQ